MIKLKKYIILIVIVAVILLALGLVFGPSMLNLGNVSGPKTYDSSEVGVSFNYPGNWEISNVKKDFSSSPNKKYVYLGDPKNKVNLTDEEAKDVCYQLYFSGFSIDKEPLADWSYEDEMDTMSTIKTSHITNGDNVTENNITVDGLPAYELRYSNGKEVQIDVVFVKNGYLYTANFIGEILDKNWESNYNLIINSLKVK